MDLIQILWTQLVNCNPILTIAIASLSCGFIIGIEREFLDKPAGLRTTMLVVLGAALFTYLSSLIADMNTTRIAANIVVGIGFIGAGTIIHEKEHVQGMTTAATIWVCGAVGMMIGAKLYLDAFIITIFVMMVLIGVGRLEHFLKTNRGNKKCLK